MSVVKTHKFNGIKYFIGVDDPYIGWCDKPKTPDKSEYPAIRLPNGLASGNTKKAKEDSITLLHECLHASNWDKSETVVDRTAADIGRLLWRLGYRRVKQ